MKKEERINKREKETIYRRTLLFDSQTDLSLEDFESRLSPALTSKKKKKREREKKNDRKVTGLKVYNPGDVTEALRTFDVRCIVSVPPRIDSSESDNDNGARVENERPTHGLPTAASLAEDCGGVPRK